MPGWLLGKVSYMTNAECTLKKYEKLKQIKLHVFLTDHATNEQNLAQWRLSFKLL